MADEWHCKQIPNGSNPLVVCERESLQAEIERFHALINNLANAIEIQGPSPAYHLSMMERHRNEWPTLWRAIDALLSNDYPVDQID